MRTLRIAGLGVLVALMLLPLSQAAAQADSTAVSQKTRWDLFLSLGYGNLAGGVSRGGSLGAGSFGLGIEGDVGAKGALRVELLGIGAQADLGVTGMFAQETKLSVSHVGVGLGYRYYARPGRYVGAGAALAKVGVCDVDLKGGPGFLGGETVSCKSFTDIPLRPRSTVALVNATAGLSGSRYSLGLRLDAGLQPSVDSDDGAMRVLNAGILAQYHFGRRGRSATQLRD